MAAKNSQALERLLTKLSAIRKTVRGEERALLDEMVLGARIQAAAAGKDAEPSEVEMHMKILGTDNKVHQPVSRVRGDDPGKNSKNLRIHQGNYQIH